jgi:hypothetical protein
LRLAFTCLVVNARFGSDDFVNTVTLKIFRCRLSF